MNKIILLGNVTRDPEIRYTQGEKSKPFARFDLAVNRKITREGEPDADFFHCTAFSKLADVIEKYIKKGSRVLITGRIQNNNYTNKNGEKVYGIQIIVEELDFAERKSRSEESNPNEMKHPEPEEDFTKIPDDLPDPFRMAE